MLKIRLKRVGRKNDPSFRIIVAQSTQGPKSGKFVEQVGFYNPRTKERKIDGERVKYWIGVGAQPSPTLHNMLINEKVIEGKKINVLPKKSPQKGESESTPSATVEQKEVTPEAPIEEVSPELIPAPDSNVESEEKESTEATEA